VGTGFFVGKGGHFVTSKHNLRDFFKSQENSLHIEDVQKRTITKVELYDCETTNKIDLCLLKALEYKPTHYFPLKSSVLGKGHEVKLAGFCNSEEPRIKSGKVLEYYSSLEQRFGGHGKNLNVQMARTDIKQCPGDSGGPVYGADGVLYGVATIVFRSKDSGQEYFLSIAGVEVLKALNSFKNKKKHRIKKDRLLQHGVKRLRVERLLK
jgi:hypothetical protein